LWHPEPGLTQPVGAAESEKESPRGVSAKFLGKLAIPDRVMILPLVVSPPQALAGSIDKI
jgi:hypothetical protein